MQENYFLNLNNLTIDKVFNYSTIIEDVVIRDLSINVLQQTFSNAIERLKEDIGQDTSNINNPLMIILNLNTDEDASWILTADDFESCINVFNSLFFNAISTADKGRKRERRLNVPEKLQCVNMSLSSLKNLINTAAKINVFNIKICYGEFTYLLVSERLTNEQITKLKQESEATVNEKNN